MKITGFEIETYESETIPYQWRDGLTGGSGGPTRQTLLRARRVHDATIIGRVGWDGCRWTVHIYRVADRSGSGSSRRDSGHSRPCMAYDRDRSLGRRVQRGQLGPAGGR